MASGLLDLRNARCEMPKGEKIVQQMIRLAALVLLLAFGYGNASATQVLGQQLYYEGGSIQITILPYEAAFINTIYLFTPAGALRIAENADVGLVYNLSNFAALGISKGDELLFGIDVNPTGDRFFMGPASRNLDDVIHDRVDYRTSPGGGIAVVGFEDLFHGGDFDLDDSMFQVTGGVGIRGLQPEAAILAVPEPGSVILLIIGLAGLVVMVNRKRFS